MISFEIDSDLRAALDAWKADDGIVISEQLRRAVRAWLEAKGRIGKGTKTKTRTRK